MRLQGLFISLLLFTLTSCDEDSNKKKELSIPFNQTALLQNLSAELILPNYQNAKERSLDLKIAADSFASKTDSAGLENLKQKLKSSYMAWQRISFLSFGPALDKNLKSNVNVYPSDTTAIENAIIQGSVNLDNLSSKTIKGFPAIDYLLNNNSSAYSLNQFQNSSQRMAFLIQVVHDLNSRIEEVNTAWISYQAAFNSQSGTSVGSSVGLSVNSLNEHFERYFRDGKLGIPLGVRSSGISRPQDSEAIYGGYPFELMEENFIAMKNFYTGASGIGFDDYLIASDAADLDAIIKTQLALIESRINTFNESFSNALANRNSDLQDLYNEMQKLIVYWKVDMPSRLGVLISYQDNDGD